jgi:hypothetical protein
MNSYQDYNLIVLHYLQLLNPNIHLYILKNFITLDAEIAYN